jgi:hypothetical protein
MKLQFGFLTPGKILALVKRKPKVKLSPAGFARVRLGLNGQTGEELILALVAAYNDGHYVHVYQALLNTEVDSTTFYSLQAQAMRLMDSQPELCSICDRSERIVRAIALMAARIKVS